MHLCERQTNFTRRTCCQLVLLLNDTARVPLCDVELLTEKDNSTRIYTPPVLLDEPSDVYEDHVTFLLGVTVLTLVALGCICTLNKLIKPRFSQVSSGSFSNYDFMMWMPPKSSQSLLPSYQSATSTPTSALSSFPPPPYTEVQRLTDEIV